MRYTARGTHFNRASNIWYQISDTAPRVANLAEYAAGPNDAVANSNRDQPSVTIATDGCGNCTSTRRTCETLVVPNINLPQCCQSKGNSDLVLIVPRISVTPITRLLYLGTRRIGQTPASRIPLPPPPVSEGGPSEGTKRVHSGLISGQKQ